MVKIQYAIIVLCLFLVSCESSTENNSESENYISANYNYTEIDNYVKSLDNELRLKNISSSNVNYDGTASSWLFRYSKNFDMDFATQYCYIKSVYNSFTCDSIVKRATTYGDAFISKSWINSTDAMQIAEENGGKQFRTDNSNCHITALLGEAVVPNSQPYWYVRYSVVGNEGKYIDFNINAVTGKIIVSG